MAKIIGAFATSHATAFIEPARWEEFRARIRALYQGKYGDLPPEQPQVNDETLEANTARYENIRVVHAYIAARIRSLRPDAVIVIGNDQNENYGELAAPQFALYTGDNMIVNDWLSETEKPYPCDANLALGLASGLVDRGFDLVQSSRFKDEKLCAHAHTQVLAHLMPEADIPVVPVFVNAITPPMAPAERCFAFGRALEEVLRALPGDQRVIIGASGGLSHFTFGYPYKALTIKRDIGTICTAFDERILDWLRAGALSRLTSLNNKDLLENGDVEFRQGLTLFGALPEGIVPDRLVYEPFYRGLMGFWAGYWPVGRD